MLAVFRVHSMASVAAFAPRCREFDAHSMLRFQLPGEAWRSEQLTIVISVTQRYWADCYSPWWCLEKISLPSLLGDQLWLGRQRQVCLCFILFVDKRVSDRQNCVIPWKSVPYLNVSGTGLAHKEALYQVLSTFTFTLPLLCYLFFVTTRAIDCWKVNCNRNHLFMMCRVERKILLTYR